MERAEIERTMDYLYTDIGIALSNNSPHGNLDNETQYKVVAISILLMHIGHLLFTLEDLAIKLESEDWNRLTYQLGNLYNRFALRKKP